MIMKYLNGENISGYQFCECSDSKKAQEDTLSFLGNKSFKPVFFNSIILTGQDYKLECPYGIACGTIKDGGVCLNRCLAKESIWHETAHLLGAEDHYEDPCEENGWNHPPKDCASPGQCFMNWDSTNGTHFCENSIREIRNLLSPK